MARSFVVLFVVGLAGFVAYEPQVHDGANGASGSTEGEFSIPAQEDTFPRRWDPDWMATQGMEPQPAFRVPVTVRTETSVRITVLGTAFTSVADQQRWVFGETSDGVTPPDSLALGEAPFWSTLPFPRDFYQRVDSTVAASLLEGAPGDSVIQSIVPLIPDTVEMGDGVTVPGDELLPLVRRPIPNVHIQRETDSGDLEPPAMCFEVEGLMNCLKPWTAHEGFLERIHIDLPDNGKFNEITVIGHYSRSARVEALKFPAMPCVWCGRVQVCSAGAGCP